MFKYLFMKLFFPVMEKSVFFLNCQFQPFITMWRLIVALYFLWLLSSADESADAQSVLREMTQVCFSSYNFHSVTIQMERQEDLKPGCNLCEDPKI